MPVVVKHHEPELIARLNAKIAMCNRLLLEDIHRESQYKTPLKDGDLREQVTKTVNQTEKTGTITWTVPYASYQERGKRFDGSHVVKNYTTPGTGKDFAKNAVKSVMTPQRLAKYLDFGSNYRP